MNYELCFYADRMLSNLDMLMFLEHSVVEDGVYYLTLEVFAQSLIGDHYLTAWKTACQEWGLVLETPDLGIKWIALTPDGSLKIYHDLVEPLSEESFNDLRFCNQNVVNLLQHHLLSEQVDWAILIDREAVSGLSELSL